MEIYYEDKADLLTIRFSEKEYGKDIEIADGKGVLTIAKDGTLQEIQIFEASSNGHMVLSASNLNIGQNSREAA
ncbi:MAG: DUF2283 domain-containing protein [Thermodesulfobacteriota bacterium]